VWDILTAIGVLDSAATSTPASFTHRDGRTGMVTRPAAVAGEARPGPDDPVVVQISRWDRLVA
jgi:trehalose synthase